MKTFAFALATLLVGGVVAAQETEPTNVLDALLKRVFQGPQRTTPELASPVLLKAADGLVDTEVGHAAPYIGDFDGDGKRDLLVGQFSDGMLKIYRNSGTNEKPVYEAAKFFETEGELVKVPTG